MVFKCTYCEKDIQGMSIIIDKTHIIHKLCEMAYNDKKKLEEEKIKTEKVEDLECCK